MMSSSFSFLGRHITIAKQASRPLTRHHRQVLGEHCIPQDRTLASQWPVEFRPPWACQAQMFLYMLTTSHTVSQV